MLWSFLEAQGEMQDRAYVNKVTFTWSFKTFKSREKAFVLTDSPVKLFDILDSIAFR